jgi:hypothetical protein
MTIDAPLDAPPVGAAVNRLPTSPILPTLLMLALPNTIAMFGSTVGEIRQSIQARGWHQNADRNCEYDIAHIAFAAMQACFLGRLHWFADLVSSLRFWRHGWPRRRPGRRPAAR